MGRRAHYDTPMSSITDPTTEANSAFSSTDDFGTNVGEKIIEVAELQKAQAKEERCNIGSTEQKIRFAPGATLLAAAAFAPVSRGWKIGFAVFGASQIITGAMSYCPLWHAIGVDTRHGKKRS